jgi:hypothetical protein
LLYQLEPGDDLLVVVAQLSTAYPASLLVEHHQGADRHQWRQCLANRTRRQGGHERGPMDVRDPHRQRRARVRSDQDEPLTQRVG